MANIQKLEQKMVDLENDLAIHNAFYDDVEEELKKKREKGELDENNEPIKKETPKEEEKKEDAKEETPTEAPAIEPVTSVVIPIQPTVTPMEATPTQPETNQVQPEVATPAEPIQTETPVPIEPVQPEMTTPVAPVTPTPVQPQSVPTNEPPVVPSVPVVPPAQPEVSAPAVVTTQVEPNQVSAPMPQIVTPENVNLPFETPIENKTDEHVVDLNQQNNTEFVDI